MEIKNIVLDIGNVLGHFCWERVFTDYLNLRGEDFDRVAAATVKGSLWPELDRSVLSDEEVLEGCIAKSPADEAVIREFFTYLGEVVDDYDYAVPWIQDMKAQGFKVYILSNFGRTSYNRCRANGFLGFVDLVDGALISYEVQKVKPEPEIYELFLKRFNLKPEECLFFDDRPENIDMARQIGMNAEVFTTEKAAKQQIMAFFTD